MYRSQLHFAMFCATNALGNFWRHLNHPNLFVRSVYRFHAHFHVRIILHHLCIPLTYDDGLSRVKNYYIKSAHDSTYGDYADET